jgi:hypothetical protein
LLTTITGLKLSIPGLALASSEKRTAASRRFHQNKNLPPLVHYIKLFTDVERFHQQLASFEVTTTANMGSGQIQGDRAEVC